MSFLESLIHHKQFFSLDIGTTSMKAVEMTRQGETFALKNYAILETFGYLERSNNALQTSNLKLLENEVALYLSLLLKRLNPTSGAAVLSVPTFSTFSTLVELPAVQEHEIAKIMQYQAQQYIPLPIASVTVDWIKVGERVDDSGARKLQILLMSIVNDHIEKYRKILQSVGIRMLGVEVEGLSLARALTSGSKEPTLILDIGGRSTGIFVAQEGFLKFAGQTDFSGGSLTQTISTGLTISPRRSEDLKRERGLLGSGGEQELSTLIEPILDVIIAEGVRVRTNYEKAYQQTVTRAILSGGASNLLGIEEYFTRELGLPTTKADPFKFVTYNQALAPVVKDLGPHLSVAVGLGMKDLR